MSNKKLDWRIKLGKERVVHDQLKIEFYQKTGKLLDLMKVEDFIEYFSLEDEVTKKYIANEIKTFKEVNISKEEKIVFAMFGNTYALNNQKEMMEEVFIKLIHMKDLKYIDLRDLPCISTRHEELNSTFDSYTELSLDEETEILLGTRLNRTDKLRYIYKLFKIAGLDPRELIFDSREFQNIWEKFLQSKESLLFSDEIIVSIERPENLIGICVIGDVKFYKSGEEIENSLTRQIRDKLINFEFHDESNEPKVLEFKNIMWNLGYNVENHFVDFEDF